MLWALRNVPTRTGAAHTAAKPGSFDTYLMRVDAFDAFSPFGCRGRRAGSPSHGPAHTTNSPSNSRTPRTKRPSIGLSMLKKGKTESNLGVGGNFIFVLLVHVLRDGYALLAAPLGAQTGLEGRVGPGAGGGNEELGVILGGLLLVEALLGSLPRLCVRACVYV